MKKILIYLFILILVLALHKIAVTYSTFPPAENTGAPGEGTCYISGCHVLGTLNGPQGNINILFNDSINYYKPDSLYSVSVTIEDTVQKIFGFELTVLDSNDTKIGDFIITDSISTYLTLFGGKAYVSHYNAGDTIGPGTFTWQFQWQAPPVNAGPVTFYTAGVAAASWISIPAGNVYTTSLAINPDTLVGITEDDRQINVFNVYPNPVDQYLYIISSETQTKSINIVMMNFAGQDVFNVSEYRNNPISIDVSKIPNGLYLLNINNSFYKKILINH